MICCRIGSVKPKKPCKVWVEITWLPWVFIYLKKKCFLTCWKLIKKRLLILEKRSFLMRSKILKFPVINMEVIGQTLEISLLFLKRISVLLQSCHLSICLITKEKYTAAHG